MNELYCPDWLQFVRLHNEEDWTDLRHLELEDPPVSLQTVPALELAYECAKCALLSNAGFAALADSFEDKINHDDIKILLEDCKVYVTKWSSTGQNAFHVVAAERPRSIVVGNVFLKFEDVVYFLPKGPPSDWTASERMRVVVVSWFLIHELSHAMGSSLAAKKKVATPRTPPRATAFSIDGVMNIKYVSWDENGNVFGERGWFLEDRLGGQVVLHETESRLILARPDKQKGYPFPDDMVTEFLTKGEPYNAEVEKVTKGRHAVLPTIKPPANLIKC